MQFLDLIAAIIMVFGNVSFVVHELSNTRAVVEIENNKSNSRVIELRMDGKRVLGMKSLDAQMKSICHKKKNLRV